MHSWKKKLVVSQLALACTLAITSQANAANYDTWGYHDNTTTDLVWPYDTDNDGIADAGGMDPMGSDGNYVTYNGFVYYNNANGDFDTVFKGDTVNGTISTYYLNHDYAREGANKRGNSSRLTQSFHFFMFEPIFSPVNALNQPI